MENRKRNIQMKFYVTEEEKRLIDEKMKQLPIKQYGAYLRKMAIDGYILVIDRSDTKAYIRELQAVSRNINQIAKRANATGAVYKQDIEDIKNGTSMPRNIFLFTNANYLLPYTGAGSGIRRALEYDPNAIFFNSVESKDMTHIANEFVITIPRNSNQADLKSNIVTNKNNQVMATNNEKSNQADGGINQIHTNLVTRKLTKKEEDIRNFCSVPRTAKEIMDRLGISNQSKNRQKYITSLIKIGVLERTIPEKPSDPNQKYRRKK